MKQKERFQAVFAFSDYWQLAPHKQKDRSSVDTHELQLPVSNMQYSLLQRNLVTSILYVLNFGKKKKKVIDLQKSDINPESIILQDQKLSMLTISSTLGSPRW